MGKKVSPYSFRLGITTDWKSKWFSRRNFKDNLLQDIAIRKHLNKKLEKASVADILIERNSKEVNVIIHSAKPGMVVGRGGEAIGLLQKELKGLFSNSFTVTVQEIRNPDADAALVAKSVAEQIERRFPFRRVCKMAVDKAKESKLKGIKIRVAGRLNGVDIARSETYNYGTVPLHTLRADIDYARAEANTTYGVIGIKVWTYKGLVFKSNKTNY